MISRTAIILTSLWLLIGTFNSTAAEPRTPGLDCAKDRSILAVLVCNDRTAALAERRATTSYLALYFTLDENTRTAFRNDHLEWLNALLTQCSRPRDLLQMLGGQNTPSVECLTEAYTLRAEFYQSKISAAALEESNLSADVLKKTQKKLFDLKLLSGKIDGMFGADTKLAIKKFQATIKHPETGFLVADERSVLFTMRDLPSQAPPETQTTLPDPIAAGTSEAVVDISRSWPIAQLSADLIKLGYVGLPTNMVPATKHFTAVEQSDTHEPEPAVAFNPPAPLADGQAVPPPRELTHWSTRSQFLYSTGVALLLVTSLVGSVVIIVYVARVRYRSRRKLQPENTSGIFLPEAYVEPLEAPPLGFDVSPLDLRRRARKQQQVALERSVPAPVPRRRKS